MTSLKNPVQCSFWEIKAPSCGLEGLEIFDTWHFPASWKGIKEGRRWDVLIFTTSRCYLRGAGIFPTLCVCVCLCVCVFSWLNEFNYFGPKKWNYSIFKSWKLMWSYIINSLHSDPTRVKSKCASLLYLGCHDLTQLSWAVYVLLRGKETGPALKRRWTVGL